MVFSQVLFSNGESYARYTVLLQSAELERLVVFRECRFRQQLLFLKQICRRNTFALQIQVLTTLGQLLEPVTGVFEPCPRWYRLTRKKASDKVQGEVCLILVVVPK